VDEAVNSNGKMIWQASKGKEGGGEHCQTGNHKLAMDYIINWLLGINTVWINTKGVKLEDTNIRPDKTIQKISDIIKII
jgi:hypothetical protein